MDPLVDLATAKAHLRITDTDHDTDVTLKVAQASDLVWNYLTSTGPYKTTPPEWTVTTVPPRVQAAILDLTTHLYEHRGDDMTPTTTGSTPDAEVWAAIRRKLARDRDPALA